ncbi:NlpC/P60 family protein [Aneurinibacillus soli]|uniref:Gamma-D-glutamyl-L-lysine endopeptidase n=1 Tax=Aneurinibacillus soli TaxID=1500254 RepID=A0A0U4WCU3_9BACL|nr:C40 family peptidase [Aneurinibacillus soli]PYE58783.1 NlpC/P60 family protein [Aneurinibacillus soli]BAU26648.1 Gamma-D-glutamyl-L-lysine endopeptidase [Aneurinibacillus soli]
MKKRWASIVLTGMVAVSAFAGTVSTASTASAASISVTAQKGSAVNIANEQKVINNIIQTGKNLIGQARYNHTYNAPYTMDCSGFTYYIFKKNGIDLKTRDDDKQVSYGKYVPKSQIKPGDLIFYNANKPSKDVTHVGVYIGDGKVLHMANSTSNVTISKLSGSWHTANYLTARRVIE